MKMTQQLRGRLKGSPPVAISALMTIVIGACASPDVRASNIGPYQVIRTFSNLDTGGIALYGGYIYSVEATYARIHQIDPLTGQNLATWTVPGFFPPAELPTGLASDGTSLWLTTRGQSASEDNLRKLSLQTPPDVNVLLDYRLPWWEMDLAYANGLFMTPEYLGPIRQIDPATGAVVGSIPSPSTTVYGLTFDGVNLLAGDGLSGTIWTLSPNDGTILDTWQTGAGGIRGLAYDQASQTLFIGKAGAIIVAQVPEPGTATLGGAGLLFVLLRRFRGKRMCLSTL